MFDYYVFYHLARVTPVHVYSIGKADQIDNAVSPALFSIDVYESSAWLEMLLPPHHLDNYCCALTFMELESLISLGYFCPENDFLERWLSRYDFSLLCTVSG
jgi:hypothetical protein